MDDYGRRLVVDWSFDRAVTETVQAFEGEGLEVRGRVDVREQVRRTVGQALRRYVLLHASPPQLMYDALRLDLDVGAVMSVTIAIYELGSGETCVVASAPFAAVGEDHIWRRECPAVAAVADREIEMVAGALSRLQHAAPRRELAVSAA